MSSERRADTPAVHDPTRGEAERVHAYFAEEVAAQEAMGLLSFHGFRTDGIALRAASGTRWWRVRPPVRRSSRLGIVRSGWVGAVLGAVVGGILLIVAGRFVADLSHLVVVLACGGAGALVAHAASGTGELTGDAPHDPMLLTPDRGCVVSVRTLRIDEARLVLERADGVLVTANGADPVAPGPQ